MKKVLSKINDCYHVSSKLKQLKTTISTTSSMGKQETKKLNLILN